MNLSGSVSRKPAANEGILKVFSGVLVTTTSGILTTSISYMVFSKSTSSSAIILFGVFVKILSYLDSPSSEEIGATIEITPDLLTKGSYSVFGCDSKRVKILLAGVDLSGVLGELISFSFATFSISFCSSRSLIAVKLVIEGIP